MEYLFRCLFFGITFPVLMLCPLLPGTQVRAQRPPDEIDLLRPRQGRDGSHWLAAPSYGQPIGPTVRNTEYARHAAARTEIPFTDSTTATSGHRRPAEHPNVRRRKKRLPRAHHSLLSRPPSHKPFHGQHSFFTDVLCPLAETARGGCSGSPSHVERWRLRNIPMASRHRVLADTTRGRRRKQSQSSLLIGPSTPGAGFPVLHTRHSSLAITPCLRLNEPGIRLRDDMTCIDRPL